MILVLAEPAAIAVVAQGRIFTKILAGQVVLLDTMKILPIINVNVNLVSLLNLSEIGYN